MKTSDASGELTPAVIPECPPWYVPLLEKLTSLQEQQRLPHAILLTLPGETDELAFIWHLSMLLLCQKRNATTACGQCTSCHLMLANTYPDFKLVTLLYDESGKKFFKNIKIEQIRELTREVYLTRSYDNIKISVVYPAEKMSIAGANSLLKTLEEPAADALIILATHNPGKIPVTLRSRCQQWQTELPEKSEALNWLKAQGLNDDVSEQYLSYANGDPKLALKLESNAYNELVSAFKKQFTLYLKNQIDVTKLAQSLLGNEAILVRRIITMMLTAYIYQFAGLQGTEAIINKTASREMITLLSQINRQLLIEENNLDFQLQLEDVLISVKQIINRSQP